ncbi:MAG: neutral zinc metallopeptidase [Candidatus Nanopelagicales bacterium]
MTRGLHLKRTGTAVALLAASLLLASCAGASTTTQSAGASPSESFSAPPGGERTGAVATSAPSGQSFSFKAQAGDDGGVDFAAYDESMDFALGAISEYWIETLPDEFGADWVQPDEFIAYYPPEEQGPDCGGEPVGAENAVYCYQGDSDYIAWDEPGLMLPFYEQFGDMADAVILAHEFGHGAQARLGLSDQFPLTIESELQADCFAGAWAAWADEQGLLGQDAANQAADAVVSVADPEGVPWNDPQAHGTADERLTAFADGVDGGATGCYDYYAPGFSDS